MRRLAILGVIGVSACGGGRRVATPAPAVPLADTARPVVVTAPKPVPLPKLDPILPPQQAFLAGMMPLRATGADTFRLQRPNADGRGVIIAILDSGIDPGLPGFRVTTTEQPKILDVRDFSGEGRVELSPVTPVDGIATVGRGSLAGFGRIARLAEPPYFGGVLRELPLGRMPASDLNANGRNTDEFAIVVAKSSTGWFAMTDADGDGSLENDTPLYDYSVSAQAFKYAPGPVPRAATIALNIAEDGGRPVLDLVFDNSGHGSHVAGIAAGHNMFGVSGFDGVAPGAQLLGLKISNNARGGISVTGSMLRAMNYAADFADRRGLPLVLNMSFGVGNEREGSAAIDSLVNEFALKHPGVLFVISAGNDGPGISTIGFPGSAELALTACALFPGVFGQAPDAELPAPPDVLGWWSARGGELTKPDLCAPGVAYSNVPAWHVGQEISGGTSMAAPHVSGLAALLQSALQQQGRSARGVDLKRALTVTARPVGGGSSVDQGAGVPNVSAALRWLASGHQSGIYRVRALSDAGTATNAVGAYRREGLRSPGDTVQRFTVGSLGGQTAARILLRPDATWLRSPSSLEMRGAPETISVSYDAQQLSKPGMYVGTVWARSATDSLGGPLFGLTSTVIVPRTLEEPVRSRETLLPGRLARFFVSVREGSAGFTAKVSVPADGSSATLYIFEPDGKPHRGGSSIDAGGKDSATVSLRVNADDVVPGVYEVTVLAPPNAPVKYSLDIVEPTVAVLPATARGQMTLRNAGATEVSARVAIALDGAVRDTIINGTGSEPASFTVPIPSWADRLVVSVAFDRGLWNAITDFGLTVFDPQGQMVSQGPMNYAYNRQVIKLDDATRGVPVKVELFPAFAHLKPESQWTSKVRVTLLAGKSRPQAIPDSLASVTLAPGASASVTLPLGATPLEMPGGYQPYLQTSATAPGGPAAVRMEAW